MKNICGCVLATVVLTVAGTASAQTSECNAVLRNGAFKHSSYINNSYYQQIVFSRFLSSTYETSKTDTSLGGGIPIGEAVMGSLNYDESAYNAKKASIDSTHLVTITQTNETQTMLSSGDGDILKAWTNCIQQKCGLAVRFELRNARMATIYIDWHGQARTYTTKLTQPVALPGIDMKSVSDPSCFRKGKKIEQGVGCRSTITLPDAFTPLNITVSAKDGSADAYLPARLKLINERSALQIPTWTHRYFRNGQNVAMNSFDLDHPSVQDKWAIDPRSITGTVTRDWDEGRSNTNWCASPEFKSTGQQIIMNYKYNSATQGGDGKPFECSMKVFGEKMRTRWVADEEVRPSPPSI